MAAVLAPWSVIVRAIFPSARCLGLLLEFLLRLFRVTRLRLSLWLQGLRRRIVEQLDEHREVVRTNVRKPPQIQQLEVIGMEYVIEGVAKQRIVRVEAIVEAATDSRIQEAAQAQEYLAGPAPP